MTVAVSKVPVHVQHDRLEQSDFDLCASTSGETVEYPLGIAAVLALRTLIASEALPDNAIMLGYQATWQEELRPGAFRTDMMIAEADAPRTRYQRVVIAYTTYASDDRLVVEQRQEVLWPVTA